MGCTDDCIPHMVEKKEYIKQKVPETFLGCAALPIEPIGAAKQSTVDAYMVELWFVADECKTNLSKVRGLVDINTTK